MTPEFYICIVVPCYNESESLKIQEYSKFLIKNPDVLVCFVNDGSSDNTYNLINNLREQFPKQVDVVNSKINLGKAEAVRKGMIHCKESFNYSFIAYLDSDLAVSLSECISLVNFCNQNIILCFGSRISRIGSEIERKWYRFFIGRIIATIISQILSLKVYDTQCGCKVFTKELAEKLFLYPFVSRWLFDVEIFFRMIDLFGKEEVLKKMIEVPLVKWIDQGKSKVKFTYFFHLWVDLYKIRKQYRYLKV